MYLSGMTPSAPSECCPADHHRFLPVNLGSLFSNHCPDQTGSGFREFQFHPLLVDCHPQRIDPDLPQFRYFLFALSRGPFSFHSKQFGLEVQEGAKVI